MRHHDHGDGLPQIVQQFLDALCTHGIERRRRLIEQQDIGLYRQRPRDAKSLLLSARQHQGGSEQSVHHFAPQSRALQRDFDERFQLALDDVAPMGADAGCHIVENRQRHERRGTLENHADPPAQRDHVGGLRVDRQRTDLHLATHDGAFVEFVQSIDAA